MAEDEDKDIGYEAIYVPGPDGSEDLDQYQPGGYHPITIGDILAGRYEIVHKLGSGAFATVWLAKDATENHYVALKIAQADASEDSNELRMHQHLQTARSTSLCVTPLLNHFFIEGPEWSSPSLGV